MRRGIIRWTYLAALVSLVAWILTATIGGYAYKNADGLVVGDMGVVSPEYTVTVLEILVRNGDRVRKGDLVARVSSTRVAEITATLSLQSSTLVTRMAEATSKAEIIDQLIASAEERIRIVQASNEALQRPRQTGFLPWTTANAIADQVYKGKEELARLKAERAAIVGGHTVPQMVAASRFTDQALEDIQVLFDAGRMKAPMDGFISSVEAGIGSVIVPGNLVAEMVGEKRFILAYVPVSRLYSLKPDAPVTIEIGLGTWWTGRISRIEPIAARLPKEFQKTLSPVERQQLIRVDFDEGATPPPYFAKVIIR
jgi:multidrug resistance efflux pump